MKRSIGIALLVLMGLPLLSSCDNIRKAGAFFGSLMDIKKQVSNSLNWDQVTVNLSNGNYLAIGVINYPLKDLTADQIKVKSRGIAQVAYDSYPSRDNLENIRVTFTDQNSFGLFHYTKDTDSRQFSASDLAKTSKVKPKATPVSAPPAEPVNNP